MQRCEAREAKTSDICDRSNCPSSAKGHIAFIRDSQSSLTVGHRSSGVNLRIISLSGYDLICRGPVTMVNETAELDGGSNPDELVDQRGGKDLGHIAHVLTISTNFL